MQCCRPRQRKAASDPVGVTIALEVITVAEEADSTAGRTAADGCKIASTPTVAPSKGGTVTDPVERLPPPKFHLNCFLPPQRQFYCIAVAQRNDRIIIIIISNYNNYYCNNNKYKHEYHHYYYIYQ